MELLVLIPIIGLAAKWQHWQKTTAAAAMLHAVSAMVLLLFLASLANLLLPASILLMAGGTLFAAIEGRRHIEQRAAPPIPFGIFAILSIAYWLLHSDSALYFYDEYSHWGVYLKEVLAYDALWGSNTNSLHPRYLPGATLWQYFFAVFSSRAEGAAYLAQFTLLLTPLLVLWEKISWRDYFWHIAIVVVFLVVVANFGHGVTSLYVDHLLGAWFIGILLNYLLETRERSAKQKLSYLLPLLVVVLIKTIGVFFVLVDAGIIFLLLLLLPRGETADSRSAAWGRALTFPVVAMILCLSVLTIWNVNRNAAGVATGEGSAANIVTSLAASESIFDESQQTELTRRFIEVVLHQQISKSEVSAQFNAFSYSTMEFYEDDFRLTTASLLVVSLFALFLFRATVVSREDHLQWTIAASCVWLAASAYIFVLFLGYRWVSATENGLILSSYVRYAHTILLPLVFFCFASLLPAFAGRKNSTVQLGENLSVRRYSLIFTVLLAAFIIFEPPYWRPLVAAQEPPEFRTATEELTKRIREEIGEDSLWVFFPSEFSNGLLGQILQYGLTPGRTQVETDVSVILERQTALRQELRQWQYAWFPAEDPAFDPAIQRLLGAPPVERLFRIDSSGADIKLIPVSGVFPGSELSN